MSMKDRDEDQIKSNKILTPLFLLPYVQWSEINKKVQYRYIGTYTQKVRFWLQYLFSTYLFVIALFFPFSSIQTVPCNNDAIYVHDFYYFFIETIMIFTEPYCWITFFYDWVLVGGLYMEWILKAILWIKMRGKQ